MHNITLYKHISLFYYCNTTIVFTLSSVCAHFLASISIILVSEHQVPLSREPPITSLIMWAPGSHFESLKSISSCRNFKSSPLFLHQGALALSFIAGNLSQELPRAAAQLFLHTPACCRLKSAQNRVKSAQNSCAILPCSTWVRKNLFSSIVLPSRSLWVPAGVHSKLGNWRFLLP